MLPNCRKLAYIGNVRIEPVIQSYLESNDTVTVDTAVGLARQIDPHVPRSTIRWQLYELVQCGTLRRVQRGVYARADKSLFRLSVPSRLTACHQRIQSELPFLRMCVWYTGAIGELAHHYPHESVDIIEVERDGESAVRDLLSNTNTPAISYEDFSAIQRSGLANRDHAVIKRLVSEAPLLREGEVPVPRLEKILVDIVSDERLFSFVRGAELFSIFAAAFERYHVQRDTLLRYASRRGAREEIREIAEQISGSTV